MAAFATMCLDIMFVSALLVYSGTLVNMMLMNAMTIHATMAVHAKTKLVHTFAIAQMEPLEPIAKFP